MLRACNKGDASLLRLTSDVLHDERHWTRIGSGQPEEYVIILPCDGPVEFSQFGCEERCVPGGFLIERRESHSAFSIPTAKSCSC